MPDTVRAFDMQGLSARCGIIVFLSEVLKLQSRSPARGSLRFCTIERCSSLSSKSLLQHTVNATLVQKKLLHPKIVHDSLSDKI